MRFCECPDRVTGQTTSQAVQLIHNGFWPATWDQPTTTFTIQMIKSFTILANQASVNAFDYVKVLRRKTDGIALKDVEVGFEF